MALLFFTIPQTERPAHQKEPTTPHTVKLRGAPFNVTEVCASNWDQGKEPWGSRRRERGCQSSAAWEL